MIFDMEVLERILSIGIPLLPLLFAIAYILPPPDDDHIWHCVTTSYSRGRVKASLTDSRSSVDRPKSTYRITKRKSVFQHWYNDIDDANDAIDIVKRQNPPSIAQRLLMLFKVQ